MNKKLIASIMLVGVFIVGYSVLRTIRNTAISRNLSSVIKANQEKAESEKYVSKFETMSKDEMAQADQQREEAMSQAKPLGYVFKETITKKSSASEIKKLQEVLAENMYFNFEITGKIDNNTIKAIHQLQKDNGLEQTNSIGPKTRDVLNKMAGVVGPCANNFPAIRVLSPNGNESYQAGQQITVNWTSCNIPATDNVRIDLLVAPFPPYGVNGYGLTNIVNSGSSTVALPPANAYNGGILSYGNNFKINVWSSTSPRIAYDLSDNLFSINAGQQASCSPNDPPSVTVLSPNGGESYLSGQQVNVTWRTCNLPYNVDTLVALMDDRIPNWQTLSLFGAVPALNYSTLVSSNGNEYTYQHTFIVPASFDQNLPPQYQGIYGGLHYKIEVDTAIDFGLPTQQINTDSSDSVFSISHQQSGCTGTTPSITITSPNGGEVYTAGQQFNLTWTTCNIPASAGMVANLQNTITGHTMTLNGNNYQPYPNTGTVSLTIPSSADWGAANSRPMTFGNIYKMKLQATGAYSAYTVTPDWSDNLFTINNSTQASISATLSSGTPASQIIHDNTSVWTANFAFTSGNAGFNVTDVNLAIPLSGTTVVQAAHLYDGNTLIASSVGGGTSIPFNGLSWNVPANTTKILTVGFDIGTVRFSAGTSGADLQTTLTSFNATNVTNGINTFGAESDPAGNHIYAFASYPGISQVSTSAQLSNGTKTISKFQVSSYGGAIDWNSLTFDVSKSPSVLVGISPSSGVSLWDVTSTPTQVSGNFVNQSTYINSGFGVISFMATSPQNVTGFKIYELRATISGANATGDYVSTTIAKDSTNIIPQASASAILSADADAPIIWSDLSAFNHSASTNDWTSEYGVNNLPSTTYLEF